MIVALLNLVRRLYSRVLSGPRRASRGRARQCTTANRYPYHDLPLKSDRGEIRLLSFDLTEIRIYGAGGPEVTAKSKTSGPGVIDLDDSFPGYKAVSYTWGVKPNTASMLIDGHLVQVPENTETALRGLLKHQVRGNHVTSYYHDSSVRHHDTLLLWIDALCIDQENLTEKSHQVAMMGDVYSSAVEVLIWLGDDDAGLGPELSTLLIDICADCAGATDDFTNLQDTLFPKSELGRRRLVGRNLWSGSVAKHIFNSVDFTAQKLDLLAKFYSLPWFSRIWIVQEALLATTATLHWGETSIPWPIGCLAGQWIHYGGNSVTSLADTTFTDAVVRAMKPLFYVSTLYMLSANAMQMLSDGYNTSEHTLSTLLIQSGTFQATDPKDSVYALLGLLPHKTRRILKEGALLTPNYKAELAAIYTEATRAIMLTERGSMAFLPRAGLHQASKPGVPPLPSWVPRYGHPVDIAEGDSVPIVESCESTTFVSPAKLPERAHRLNVLRLKAHITHTISTVGPQLPGMLDMDETNKHKKFAHYIACFLETWDIINRTLSPSELREQPQVSSVALTLCCGRTADNEEAYNDTDFLGQLLPLIEVFREYKPGDAIPTSVFPLFLAIGANSVNRHFFVTAEGSLGMGPPGIQEGDRVAFIFGCAQPFVLRSVEDHWLLVGDVYLTGYMNKSYWQELRDKGVLEDVVEWIDIH